MGKLLLNWDVSILSVLWESVAERSLWAPFLLVSEIGNIQGAVHRSLLQVSVLDQLHCSSLALFLSDDKGRSISLRCWHLLGEEHPAVVVLSRPLMDLFLKVHNPGI